jgi:hypothetical protein
MLQVSVHYHDGFAARVVEACRDGDLLAEIAAERDGADAPVFRIRLAQVRQRVVAAAVVDEQDLVIVALRRFGNSIVRIGDQAN